MLSPTTENFISTAPATAALSAHSRFPIRKGMRVYSEGVCLLCVRHCLGYTPKFSYEKDKALISVAAL